MSLTLGSRIRLKPGVPAYRRGARCGTIVRLDMTVSDFLERQRPSMHEHHVAKVQEIIATQGPEWILPVVNLDPFGIFKWGLELAIDQRQFDVIDDRGTRQRN